MSFRVDEQYVRRLARKVDDLGTEAPAATEYVQKYLDIGYAEARLFATVAKACSDARAALESNYGGMERLAAESSAQLYKAASMYQNTDTAEARRLDATY